MDHHSNGIRTSRVIGSVSKPDPVTQKKSGLDFVKTPIFRNSQKPTKTQNPIPVEPINKFYFFKFLIMFLYYVLCFKFSIKKLRAGKKKRLDFLFSVLYLWFLDLDENFTMPLEVNASERW